MAGTPQRGRGRDWDPQLIFFRVYSQWTNTHFIGPDCLEFLSPPRNDLGTKNTMHTVLEDIWDLNCMLQDDTDSFPWWPPLLWLDHWLPFHPSVSIQQCSRVTQENMTSAEGACDLQSLKGSVITPSLAVPSREGQAPTLRDILALKWNPCLPSADVTAKDMTPGKPFPWAFPCCVYI